MCSIANHRIRAPVMAQWGQFSPLSGHRGLFSPIKPLPAAKQVTSLQLLSKKNTRCIPWRVSMQVVLSWRLVLDPESSNLRGGSRPSRKAHKWIFFHIDYPSLLSIPVQWTFHKHRHRSGTSRVVNKYRSHAVVVVDCCSVLILSLGLSAPRILASTSTKHCDTYKTTNCCSNPVKVSINEPPHTTCRRELGTDVVNGRAWIKTIVMLVILTSQNDKTHPSKDATWHSLAKPST